MVTSRQLRVLATRPSAFLAWKTTGKLPQGIRPASALLDVLRRIPPIDRPRLRVFCIDETLGYTGRHVFSSVAHAMHWLAPSEEVFDSFPAEAYRIKSFARTLEWADVLDHCEQVPEDLRQRLMASPLR
jgi:hypothetical protein